MTDDDGRMRARLAGLMALIYAVQGAFWPLLTLHLGDLGVSERGRGWIFGAMALASFVVPLGVGQLVDRFVPTQRYLSGAFAAVSLILAALGAGGARPGAGRFAWFLGYWLVMVPCSSLGNSLAFRHLARPDRDFGRVRLWGTIGWMAAGWLVSLLMLATSAGRGLGRGAPEAFWVAAACSLVASAYSLTLPHTPPVRPAPGGRPTTVGRDVADLLRRPGVAVYLVSSFGVSVATPFVYQVMPPYLRSIGMDRAWVASAMTLGQWPEVFALALVPVLIRRLGYRGTLALGVGAYAVRFLSLAAEPGLTIAILGIPLHGVGVACFSIVGQVFLNSQAPADRRASTQAVNTVINGGCGAVAGSLLAGEVVGRSPDRPGLVFLVPGAIHLALVALLLIAFRPGPAGRPASRPGERGV